MSNAEATAGVSDPKMVKDAVREVRKAIRGLSPEDRQVVEAKVFSKKPDAESPAGPSGFTQAVTIAGGGVAVGLAALAMAPSAAAAIIGASVGAVAAAVANRKEKDRAAEK